MKRSMDRILTTHAGSLPVPFQTAVQTDINNLKMAQAGVQAVEGARLASQKLWGC